MLRPASIPPPEDNKKDKRGRGGSRLSQNSSKDADLNSSFLTNLKNMKDKKDANFFSGTSSLKFGASILSEDEMKANFVFNRSRYGFSGLISDEDKDKLSNLDFAKQEEDEEQEKIKEETLEGGTSRRVIHREPIDL